MSPQETIKTLHKVHGLQITEIAERIKVSRTTVYNWQNGRVQPRPHIAKALRRILDQYEVQPQRNDRTNFIAIMESAKEEIAQSLGLDPAAIAILIKQ